MVTRNRSFKTFHDINFIYLFWYINFLTVKTSFWFFIALQNYRNRYNEKWYAADVMKLLSPFFKTTILEFDSKILTRLSIIFF